MFLGLIAVTTVIITQVSCSNHEDPLYFNYNYQAQDNNFRSSPGVAEVTSYGYNPTLDSDVQVEEDAWEAGSVRSQRSLPVHYFLTSKQPDKLKARRDEFNFPNIEHLFSSAEASDNRPGFGGNLHQQNADSDYVLSSINDNADEFVVQSDIIPDSENFGSFYVPSEYSKPGRVRPYFWTGINKDFLEDSPRRPSYIATIQKIDLPKKRNSTSTTAEPLYFDDVDSNRYQEIELVLASSTTTQSPKRSKNSNKRINDMMKKYLSTLLVEKYGGFQKRKTDRKYSGLNTQNVVKSPKQDPQSKFLYGDALWNLKNKTISKIKQLFSLFTLVKFNHTECNATNWAGTWQGVCLTSDECTQWNGMAMGDCASGYGVCCVFRGSCGDSSSRNCTYFKSPNYPDFYPSNGGTASPTTTPVPTTFPTPDPRKKWYHHTLNSYNFAKSRQMDTDTTSCIFRVYKTNSDVQQMRIDFIDLDLAGPTNGTCVDEMLVIAGQNSNDQIPVICGYNTGQHVYVDVSQLNGPLQIMVLSATGDRKRFKIKICQYTDSCGSSQSNCLQYYTGVSGVIQSFNYDQAAMLNRSSPGYFNNLNYAICIRREAGYCSITFTNVPNGVTYPFQIVNSLTTGELTIPAGQAGVDILNCPDDYIIIDGTRLCGDRFNDGSTNTDFTMNAAVVDTSTGPIVINVRTNANVTGLGFKLFYMQNLCPAS